MNKRRYTIPVLIAAALHAVLLFGFKAKPSAINPVLPSVQPPEITSPTQVIESVTTEQEHETDRNLPPRGGGSAVPEQSDLPRPVTERVVFTVPLVDSALKPTSATFQLPNGLPGGPQEGRWISSDGPGVIPGSKLDQTPRAIVQPPPEYPWTMRKAGVNGTAEVQFVVDGRGQVVTVTILHATNPDFAEAAMRAVMKWRFQPGRRNGRIVSFRLTVPLEFTLAAD